MQVDLECEEIYSTQIVKPFESSLECLICAFYRLQANFSRLQHWHLVSECYQDIKYQN